MTELVDLPGLENSTDLNEDSYDDLIVSIEASVGKLSLLIAVCDDVNFRNQIIDRYETELQPETRPYRVTLDRKEPSLRAAIAQLIQSNDYLQKNSKAIITVTGTEELYFLRLGEERSEQEIFFGYLQWTREALREFHYPIVLWVNNQILNSLIKQAPDFWSWRKGVFHFGTFDTSHTSKKNVPKDHLTKIISMGKTSSGKSAITNAIFSQGSEISLSPNDFQENPDIFSSSTFSETKNALSAEELKQLIHDLDQVNNTTNTELLIALCERAGELYKERLGSGKFTDYKTEQELAVKYFRRSIDLRKQLHFENGLDNTLLALGSLYENQGDIDSAKNLYLQGLDILQQQHNYQGAINSLNKLAGIHHTQGQFEEAIKLYNQALAIYENGKDTDIATYASTINLLASTYHAQERYTEAEQLYNKALDIRKQEFGESDTDVAVSLNNLALLYYEQGKLSESESYYQQALGIQRKLLGDTNPDIATSLNNLALLYYAQSRLTEAEAYLVDALKIRQKLLGDNHPDVAGSLNNLAGLYKAQGRFTEAEPLYELALAIAITSLGSDHPITLRFQESLAKLREQLSLSQRV